MTATPMGLNGQWAFNIGIQLVSKNALPNSASSMVMFPVLHEAPPPDSDLEKTLPLEALEQMPTIVPLKLSKEGQIIEWGAIPDPDAD